eukprot:scaffold80429_cov66-Attheya_sp.AAC.4
MFDFVASGASDQDTPSTLIQRRWDDCSIPSKKGERNVTKRATKKKPSSSKRITRTPPPRKKASERIPFAPVSSNACCTPQPKQHAVGYAYRYTSSLHHLSCRCCLHSALCVTAVVGSLILGV